MREEITNLLENLKSFMRDLWDTDWAKTAMKYETQLDKTTTLFKGTPGGHTAERRRLESVRSGITKRAQGCGFEYFVTVNFFNNTSVPAEVFIRIAKEGTAIAGFVEALAITMSIALQYGVPWDVLYNKYLHQIFEPRDDKNSSLVDALGKTIDEVIKTKQSKPVQGEHYGDKGRD